MRLALSLTHLALLACGLTSLLLTAPPDTPVTAKVLFSSVVYGPLLLFLPASLLADKRLLAWLSFLLMFYFAWFVTEVLDPPPMRYWALANLGLCVLLFSLLVVVIRTPVPGDTDD